MSLLVFKWEVKGVEAMVASEHTLGSSSKFELLVQSVTDYAIFMLDPQGRVASWNPGAHRFKGYEPEEIIGEHFSRMRKLPVT